MAEFANPRLPIVIVDDEETVLASESNILLAHGFTNVVTVQDPRTVLDVLTTRGADLVLLDLSMPSMSGQEVLAQIRDRYPDLPVIIVTGDAEISSAVECIRMGAVDYMVKAIEQNRLISGVERALEIRELKRTFGNLRDRVLDQTLQEPGAFASIITNDSRIRAMFLFVEAIARTRETVLVTGETGVGKELVAEAIHRASGRTDPFVRVNSAGLDDQMFSDALFGHRKGAFTGAMDARKGLVTTAGSGTVFLDEIGDLSTASQVKLLELLERREYYPLGADLPRRTEARFVVATHRDLRKMAENGEFRKDLYYRLSTHSVRVPPLRERVGDLDVLLPHFLDQACIDMDREPIKPTSDVLQLLRSYDFPGNVRELRSLVYDAVARHTGGALAMDTFLEATGQAAPPKRKRGIIRFDQQLPTINEAIDQLIDEALDRTGGNQSAASTSLGITPQALSRRLIKRKEADE